MLSFIQIKCSSCHRFKCNVLAEGSLYISSFYTQQLCFAGLLSSPEHNVLGVCYCDRPVSVVCRPQFASTDISSVTTGRISTTVQLIGLFLWRSSTKIAQIVPHLCTKWPPELKIEKKSNNISSVTAERISTKLKRVVPWKVLYQNCSKWPPELKIEKILRTTSPL